MPLLLLKWLLACCALVAWPDGLGVNSRLQQANSSGRHASAQPARARAVAPCMHGCTVWCRGQGPTGIAAHASFVDRRMVKVRMKSDGSHVGGDSSSSGNPRLTYTDGPVRSIPGSWANACRLVRESGLRSLRIHWKQQINQQGQSNNESVGSTSSCSVCQFHS